MSDARNFLGRPFLGLFRVPSAHSHNNKRHTRQLRTNSEEESYPLKVEEEEKGAVEEIRTFETTGNVEKFESLFHQIA